MLSSEGPLSAGLAYFFCSSLNSLHHSIILAALSYLPEELIKGQEVNDADIQYSFPRMPSDDTRLRA